MFLSFAVLLLNASQAQAAKDKSRDSQAARTSYRVSNPLFGFTHLQPSPFTVPGGTLFYGTVVGYGLTDFLQVSTDVVRDIYQVYNVGAKASLIDHELFAVAVTFGYEWYNLRWIADTNPDLEIKSMRPGAVVSIALGPYLALTNGLNLNFTNAVLVTSNIVTSGYARGATVGSDLSIAYSRMFDGDESKGVGNVLALGTSLDLQYKVFGLGVSHHWNTSAGSFQLGIHYYPNADKYRVQPIIVGGGSIQL